MAGFDTPNPTAGIDAARFEVVKNALISAAEEMKIVLAKTAYSPLLKMAGDYSCGIFSATGDMVAQGPDLPIHLGSMPDAVRSVVQTFPEPKEGEVYIHNDPYHGGSHLPDVNVVMPAFFEGRLLGYGCVRAHWPDIGGGAPGSYSAVTEIYGEGLRMPPTRIYVDGKPDENIERFILANVRAPSERQGDLRAQVAANRRAVDRMASLAAKYGTDELLRIMDAILDYSEVMMRAALRGIPDGTARFVDTIDGDGIVEPGEARDQTFKVALTLTKTGDEIVLDFAGSDPRVKGPMNAPLTVTASGCYAALKWALDPKALIPPNSGSWRPVTVTAPKGCVVNAQEPAPVTYANHEMSARISDIVFRCLHELAPGRTPAGSQGTGGVTIFGGQDYRNGNTYISYEVTKGGFGARPMMDGMNGVSTCIGNMLNTPVEIMEMSFPVRIEEYTLAPDTGGAGRYRGGLAVRRIWRVLGADANCATCVERTMTPPFGLDGGKDGACAEVTLVLPDGTRERKEGKGGFAAPKDSLLIFQVPGSGGYGDPALRDPEALRADLAAGYVTPEAAARDYPEAFAILNKAGA